MRGKYILAFMLLICNVSYSQNGGINTLWLSGYGSFAGPPFGNITLDFYTGAPLITYDSFPMPFGTTHANVSDTNGNILFYTNGIYIENANHQIMVNGNGLNPSPYTTANVNYGLPIPEANLIIPVPGSTNLYYLFHGTIDSGFVQYARYLYLTTIDMSMNGGLGQVISKNVVKIQDTLNIGKIAACKHANGRDWWIFCHRGESNIFYSFLITPYGINGPYQQAIGIVRYPDDGQMLFSPDGNKLAYYSAYDDLEVFDFDRCTGSLSNPQFVFINDTSYGAGCAFSSNSDVLYLSSYNYVYQFDLTAPNLAAAQSTVAVYDNFVSGPNGYPQLPTRFYVSALAPDGKIYITTGNSTIHMHVINNPDSLGVGCDVVQHGIPMPALYFNTLPNHPNYFLGADSGSVCDSLTFLPNPSERGAISARAAPNPNNGVFTLQFPVQSVSGEVKIYDVMGNLVFKDYIAAWSQYKKVGIGQLARGMYMCKLRWGNTVGSVKVIKE